MFLTNIVRELERKNEFVLAKELEEVILAKELDLNWIEFGEDFLGNKSWVAEYNLDGSWIYAYIYAQHGTFYIYVTMRDNRINLRGNYKKLIKSLKSKKHAIDILKSAKSDKKAKMLVEDILEPFVSPEIKGPKVKKMPVHFFLIKADTGGDGYFTYYIIATDKGRKKIRDMGDRNFISEVLNKEVHNYSDQYKGKVSSDKIELSMDTIRKLQRYDAVAVNYKWWLKNSSKLSK